jgi:phosphohistidine swiveling domain-containing protein
MKNPRLEPIRTWDHVFECIERIVAYPHVNTELIKALTINLRAETGSLPGYQGSGFAERADSIALSKRMREKLETLMMLDLSSDEMYLLIRQLVKSLPFFGASQDEIRAIRGLAEEIEYTFPCPITEDIRGEIHNKLSPRNLDFVRALLSYAEHGNSEPLHKINKYQKVFQYQPAKFAGIMRPLKELERELANIFEPHPGRIEDRVSDIYQLMSNIAQIVSPQVNNYLRYLMGSIEKGNESLIQTNLEILLALLREAGEKAENPNHRVLFETLKVKLEDAGKRRPEDILNLIHKWRRDAVALFFPALIDPLEEFIECLRSKKALKAALLLGDIRMSLRGKIKDPLIQSQTIPVTLEAIWLDLTLERIGYILFGEVNNVILADITSETLPVALDVIHSMVLNVRAKGQGTEELEHYASQLLELKHSSGLNFYTVYSILERIDAEIGVITDKMVEIYHDLTREIFALRQIPNAEEAASAFVDGLFRETTLQHLSELTLKLLSFSRSRIAGFMKRVRHPPIREISLRKVAKIRQDLDALAANTDPSKLAYFFRPGLAEGGASLYPILGEKGAHLTEMARLGVNVPPGFVLTSKLCNTFFHDGRVLRSDTRRLLFDCVAELEEVTGCLLGAPERPLLLAVRAGSCVSMPGMMDTILNIGLNDETVEGFARTSGDPVFAYECYFRLIAKYASSVMGCTSDGESPAERIDGARGTPEEMKRRVKALLEWVRKATASPFPQDPREQLLGALGAIFSSWRSDSATTYRQIFNIPHHFGTAATIQQMVFGNRGQNSCSGVVFSRNPITGEPRIFGEYLPCCQGELLVCGRGNPLPLSAYQDEAGASLSLECRFPAIHDELKAVARRLELHFRDMQDIEFTVDDGVLYLLQTRAAKRTDYAALKTAVDLAREKVIDERTAVARLQEAELKQLFLPVFSPSAPKRLLARGNPASPGVATGKLAFSRADAIKRAHAGEHVILVADRTTPNDIGAISSACGVLTREGGMTSHAAINSRRMAKPCVTGCQALDIDKEAQSLQVDLLELGPGDAISIDGYSGEVFLGEVDIIDPGHPDSAHDTRLTDLERYLNTYLAWQEQFSMTKGSSLEL